MQMREKVGKSRNTVLFPMICGSGGSKSRLAKVAGAEPAGQMRDEKLHAVVARSTFPSEKVQNTWVSEHFWKLRCRKSARRCGAKHISKSKCTKHHCRTTFGSCDVEKVYAVVARSRYPSQNVQNTPCTDHFWKLRCRKSVRRCGAKQISKSKCTKHTMYGPLLEVEMSKKCTPVWREAHFEVKMYKTHQRTMYGPFLEVQMSFRMAGARDCGPCQKWAKREGFVAFSTTTTTTLHSTTLHYTTLHYTTLHNTTLHYLPLHFTTLHYTTLNYTTTTPTTTLHYTSLHYITLHYTTFHDTPLHYTTLHLHYYTEWHCTTDRQADRQIDR